MASNTLLVVGDSLSAGYGLNQDEGWVHKLAQRLEKHRTQYDVINASITGDTTHGGLTRLPAALNLHQPAIVIIELGANDGLRGLSLRLAENNLREMVRLSRQAGARVLLLGVKLPRNYGRLYGEQFHSIYTDLAQKKQVPLVSFFLEGVAETPALMQADGIHPGKAAQKKILENVWQGLEALLD